jgi:3-oxoacyl-[acyl-carrier protein] reductase
MKTAFVTGVGSDIGREVAVFLGSKGYKILSHDMKTNEEALEKSHNELKKRGIPYSVYYADLSNTNETSTMCDKILKNENNIGAIIQVAGGSTAFGHDQITPDQIINATNVNLVSQMIITHKLLPKLTDGSIVVFTVALSGIHAGWYLTDACFDAAKGEILRFAENMARNLGPKTRVNSIAIGLSYVDDNYKDWRDGIVPKIPMGRLSRPEDYVKCVEFFLSHEYITAVTLRLDGGWFTYTDSPPFKTAMMVKGS